MGRASKAELRDMRRVEVNFQYHTPPGPAGRRRREEERPVRDVDISSLPRDEQAYFRIQQAQREMATRQIGNITIPPVRPRETVANFPPLSPGAAPSAEASTTRTRPVESFPPLGGSQPTPSTSTRSAPPPAPSHFPPEVASRHAAVLQKAGRLLNNDTEKLAEFKTQVSSFRHSESTATDLIDRLWDIFNAKLDEFGKLITSIADLFDFDVKPKRTELLGAWNDWKIQVQQFSSGFIHGQMQEANSAASTGFYPQQAQRSRILALKSSSKGRPSTGTQSVWNRIEAVAASRPVAPSSSVTQRLGAMNLSSATRPAVPWTGTSASSAPRPAVVRPPQSTVRNTTFVEEFPSLPAVKPRERVALNTGPARPVATWGAESRPSNTVPETPSITEVAKGKGKKKGKTVLFHVG